MSKQEEELLEPLDPSLTSLFGDERARTTPAPAEAKARVLARLETSLGPHGDHGGGGEGGSSGGSGGGGGGGSAGGATSTALTAGKLLPIALALVVGGIVGGAIVSAYQPPQKIVYVDRALSAAAPETPIASSVAIAISIDHVPSGSNVPSPSMTTVAAPSSSMGRDVALAAEGAILDVARTALGRGDGAHALEAVDRHAREFPRGRMAEEREAIAVQALVKLGRKDEAAARGERFRKRYPNSVLAPVIDAALMVGKPENSATPR